MIFAVGTFSTHATSGRYVNFSWLCSRTIAYREEALKMLSRCSIYTSGIDVAADDQLLLLIPCVDDSAERRVIAARRIREDESEAELQQRIRRMRPK